MNLHHEIMLTKASRGTPLRSAPHAGRYAVQEVI